MKKLLYLLIFILGVISTYFSFRFFPKLTESLNQSNEAKKYDSVQVFRPQVIAQQKKYVFPAKFNTREIAVFVPKSFVSEILKRNGSFVKKDDLILRIQTTLKDSNQVNYNKSTNIIAPADGYLSFENIHLGNISGPTRITVRTSDNLAISTMIPHAVFSIIKDDILSIDFETPLMPELKMRGKYVNSKTKLENGILFEEVEYKVDSLKKLPFDAPNIYFNKLLVVNTKFSLPRTALYNSGVKYFVKKFVDGQIIVVEVKVLQNTGTAYIVEGDLSGTDMILTFPNQDKSTDLVKVPKL